MFGYQSEDGSMKVGDVQTWGVVSVLPEDSVDRAIALMLGHRASGLPVIDANGALVGVITEGDLLRRAEIGTEVQRSQWRELLAGPGKLAEDYTRAHGRTVSELMTGRVVTIASTAPLAEAVDLMTRHKIKRIPVVDGDRVVGVLSRADVLRALSLAMSPRRPEIRSDADLRVAIEAELAKLPFANGTVEFVVCGGEVTLSGAIMDDRERGALKVAVENIPGVSSVRDDLLWISPMALASGL